MNRLFGFFLVALIATVVGCEKSEKLSYANVSGTVNYNGKPIEKGQIVFSVAGYPPTVSDIVDGKYTGQAVIGSNRVSVSAKKKGTAPAIQGAAQAKNAETQRKGYMKKLADEGTPVADADPSMVDYIPAEWGTESKQTRVVEAGAPNKFDIEIKGK
jgi:hypothetical protein